MNSDIIKGEWSKLKGEAKAKWGKLTDDELMAIEGDVETLIGTVRSKYGYEHEKAKAEVNKWLAEART